MEGDSHDPVGEVERLLDAVAVVDVDVDVKYSGVNLRERVRFFKESNKPGKSMLYWFKSF